VQRRIGRQHARSVARAMTAGLSPGELRQLETLGRKLADQARASASDRDSDPSISREDIRR
jgi:hypothetical protein